jgi:hypothetical protein
MTPLASIGKGVSILNLLSYPETGSPSLTPTVLQNDLGSKSDNSSFAVANNTTDPVTLNVSLQNVTSSSVVSNTQFIGYIKIDGAIYRFVNYTNASGYYDLKLNLTGTMALLVSTLPYKNSSQQFKFDANNYNVPFSLQPAARYNNVIHLNSTYNKSWQLPDNLSISNSLMKINNTRTSETNGTNFTYYVKNGTYDFTFVNISYVPKAFYSNISGDNVHDNQTLVNYILSLHNNNNSLLSWTFIISPKQPFSVQNHAVSLLTWINLTAGSYQFTALVNNTNYASKAFQLNTSIPEEVLEFNATANKSTFSFVTNGADTLLYTNITMNPGTNGDIALYKFGVSRTWVQGSLNITVNGTSWANTTSKSSGYTNFSLSRYYKYNPGTKVEIVVAGSQYYTSNGNSAVAYYYETSLYGSGVRAQ